MLEALLVGGCVALPDRRPGAHVADYMSKSGLQGVGMARKFRHCARLLQKPVVPGPERANDAPPQGVRNQFVLGDVIHASPLQGAYGHVRAVVAGDRDSRTSVIYLMVARDFSASNPFPGGRT